MSLPCINHQITMQCWENVLWADSAEAELFVTEHAAPVYCVKRAPHTDTDGICPVSMSSYELFCPLRPLTKFMPLTDLRGAMHLSLRLSLIINYHFHFPHSCFSVDYFCIFFGKYSKFHRDSNTFRPPLIITAGRKMPNAW